MYSIIVPVHGNEESIPDLLAALRDLRARLSSALEVVFVDDGSPDASMQILARELPNQPFASKLIAHSRNFGAFAAIHTGLVEATGPYFAIMSADLQEPIDLVEQFLRILERDEADIALGQRDGRDDPIVSSLASRVFWFLYRALVQPEVPRGGVDVFGCNQRCRDQLVVLHESNTSLVGLVLWLGFRRAVVSYRRQERKHGRSGWSFRRKLKYMVDSLYGFSDLPIRLLTSAGAISVLVSVTFGGVVLVQRLRGAITVPGYTVLVLMIMFFGGLNALGLGIVGGYVWRAHENTKQRPNAIVMSRRDFRGRSPARDPDAMALPVTERA
jgi:glycosyltransferase involved in cell wall biosynthesis